MLCATPVKWSKVVRSENDTDDSVIKRPDPRSKRRITLQPVEVPEERIAPAEIFTAPKPTWTRRRFSLVGPVEPKVEAARRRSTQLTELQKTPKASRTLKTPMAPKISRMKKSNLRESRALETPKKKKPVGECWAPLRLSLPIKKSRRELSKIVPPFVRMQ
ncbi:unnamed protein product [Caenorhabditis sp. 36 PRJEB53466]|nr:unnamed protein product [Caenorhabditis sp. 36 PRJEB53466]